MPDACRNLRLVKSFFKNSSKDFGKTLTAEDAEDAEDAEEVQKERKVKKGEGSQQHVGLPTSGADSPFYFFSLSCFSSAS